MPLVVELTRPAAALLPAAWAVRGRSPASCYPVLRRLPVTREFCGTDASPEEGERRAPLSVAAGTAEKHGAAGVRPRSAPLATFTAASWRVGLRSAGLCLAGSFSVACK